MNSQDLELKRAERAALAAEIAAKLRQPLIVVPPPSAVQPAMPVTGNGQDKLDRLIAAVQTLADALRPQPLKGDRLLVLDHVAATLQSAYVLDCRGYNAVRVEVYATGANPSATVAVTGSEAEGPPFLALPDPNATKVVTADTAFDVLVSARYVRAEITQYTSGIFTVYLTPYRAAGQAIITRAKGPRTHAQVTLASSPSPSAVLLLAANVNRKMALLVNAGSNTVYLGKDTSVTVANGIPLLPNASLTDDVSTDAWYGIMAANQAGDVRIVEVA